MSSRAVQARKLLRVLAKGSIPVSSLVISPDEGVVWLDGDAGRKVRFPGLKEVENLFNAPRFQKISGPHLQSFGLCWRSNETRTQLPGTSDYT